MSNSKLLPTGGIAIRCVCWLVGSFFYECLWTCVFVNSLTSPWRGSGGSINDAVVPQGRLSGNMSANICWGQECTLTGIYTCGGKRWSGALRPMSTFSGLFIIG